MIQYKSLIKTELKAAIAKLSRFKKQLEKIPKGTLVSKKVKGKDYFYLNAREDHTVKTKYLGKITKSQVRGFENRAVERKKLKAVIKDIKKEIKYLEKTMG